MKASLVSVAGALLLARIVDAASVLAPFSGTGNAANTGPFLLPSNLAPDIRYQQVYGASDFERLGVGLFQITEIRFTEANLGVERNLPNIRIDLSTTSRNPDGLSTVFAENVGGDDTVVFSGPLHFFSDVPPFGIHIPLQTPFLYDSRNGNLLMDVRNYQTVPFSFVLDYLSAEDTLGDTVSSVGGRVDAMSGGTDTEGLRTRFTVTFIPEPSTGTLFQLGLMTLAYVLKRKGKFRAAIVN